MRSQTCSNKICSSLNKEREQFLHLMRLYSIKPTIQINPPKKPKFLKNNQSKLMENAKKQFKIDYENMILAKKINDIKIKNGRYNKNVIRPKTDYPAFRRSYFNCKYEDIEKMKDIIIRNIFITQRINSAKSYYSTENLFEEAKKQEKYLHNIMNKSKSVRRPPELNFCDIDQFKDLVEKNEDVIEEVEEDDEKSKGGKKDVENENEKEDKKEGEEKKDNNINNNVNKEIVKNSSTNNSTGHQKE